MAPLPAPVDDCWKRIGVRGDKSCPRLPAHVHCRNCEAHAEAAIRMLEHFSSAQDDQADERPLEVPPPEAGGSRPTLLFRLGEDWFGLPTLGLLEVMPQRPIRPLPHMRGSALLGVSNVHGALLACLSLSALLDLPAATASAPADPRIPPRMLVLSGNGGPVVAPVDEVDGIHRLPPGTLREPHGGRASRLTHGLLQWQQRSITVLDEARLRDAIAKSLS